MTRTAGRGQARQLRLAVLGGGTAGFMAAAHLSHRFPELELVHLYDSRHPALGVGEGTLPAFPPWLHAVTGVEMPELAERCDVTYKLGVRFEGWGRAHPVFFHNFAAGAYAYHLSAARLPRLLGPAIRGRHLDRRVEDLASDGRRVELRLAGGETLSADFVVDARGFPRDLDDRELVPLPGIPTNAALLRRGPVSGLVGGTRAVARPCGWIFVIPLARDTAYGYVFDRRLTPAAEVRRDFGRFFRDEEAGWAPGADGERCLRFPSFRRRSFFDGALFRLGNAASFLEPLEATAIGLIQHQLEVASLWLGDELVGAAAADKRAPAVLAEIDRDLGEAVDAVALFVAWHYLAGSLYDTPFWRRARESAERALRAAEGSALGERFQLRLAAARRLPAAALARLRDPEVYAERIAPELSGEPAPGGFDEASFAQVGHGLGLFAGDGPRRPAGEVSSEAVQPPIHREDQR